MNPDFSAMTRSELKRYVLSHREDMEAMRELFINRSDPRAYPTNFGNQM